MREMTASAFSSSPKGTVLLMVALLATVGTGAEYTVAPERMVAFFQSGGCPVGWVEMSRAQGQLLLSTADAANDFQSTDDLFLGNSWRLQGETQPRHSHRYSRQMCASRDLDSFGDGQGTHLVNSVHPCNMVDTMNCDNSADSAIAETDIELPFAQLRACASLVETAVPVNTIAYFDDNTMTDCPDGWSPFDEAEGRFMRAKSTSDLRTGSITNTVSPLSTSSVEELMHVHGIRVKQTLGTKTKRNYGYQRTYSYGGDGRDTIDFTAVSDASGLHLPFAHMLTCKATQSNIGNAQVLPEQPPDGALMFFDDGTNGQCAPAWQDVDVNWQQKFLLVLPAGEEPKVWGSGRLNAENASAAHSHYATYSFQVASTDNKNWGYLGHSGKDFQYIDNRDVITGTVATSEAYTDKWIACPTAGQCNVDGGKVLARFGRFVAGQTFSATNNGEQKYNYVEMDGAFDCVPENFGGDPTLGQHSSWCEIAPLAREAIPYLDVRFCRSTGALFSSPTTSPSLAPSLAPSKSPFVSTPSPTGSPTLLAWCNPNDRALWREKGLHAEFDTLMRECARECSVSPAQTKPVGVNEMKCVETCVESGDTGFSGNCAICMRRWLVCLAESCTNQCNDGSGIAGRIDSVSCSECSKSYCNDPFAACSTQNLQIGPFSSTLDTVVLDDEQSGNTFLIAGLAAGGALLMIGLIFVRRSSRKNRHEDLLDILATNASADKRDQVENAASTPEATEFRFKVLYDFHAENEDELSVTAGQHVIGIGTQATKGWWYVECFESGAIGLVPAEYLEKLI